MKRFLLGIIAASMALGSINARDEAIEIRIGVPQSRRKSTHQQIE